MAENTKTKYINISNRKFKPTKYSATGKDRLGYKPTKAYWCSLEAEDDEFLSAWDEEYGETFDTDENGNIYATTVVLKPSVYVLNPNSDDTVLLEGFFSYMNLNGKSMTQEQKRRMLVELVKTRKKLPNVEYVICQIDNPGDLNCIEKIFGGCNLSESDPDSVYENLGDNVVGAFYDYFSGVEMTNKALDLDTHPEFADGIYQEADYKKMIEPRYNNFLGAWEMHSIAFFDTDCFDVIEEKCVNQHERLNKYEGPDFDY